MSGITYLPMPKHVGLSLHVIKQTRSKDLVTVLNKTGHALSCCDAQRYITSITNSVEDQEKQNRKEILCILLLTI